MCFQVALTLLTVTDQQSHVNGFHNPRATEQTMHEMNWLAHTWLCIPPVQAALFPWILFAMAQYPYGIGLCPVQHSVSSQLNLGKHSTWLLLGQEETDEILQTKVPCRKQIFGICALRIAISGLLMWILKGLSIWCVRSPCVPGLSSLSGLSVSAVIDLIFTV